MNKDKKYFYNNINLLKEDVSRARIAIENKGIKVHIRILNRIKVWSEDEKIDYRMIASSYRYDKRIREVLFKYISYLEEYYRGLILDKYCDKCDNINFELQLKEQLKKYNTLEKAIEEIDFSTLITQMNALKDNYMNVFVFPNDGHHKKNLKALVTLRNSVMHNKLLILYRGFDECYLKINEYKGSSRLKDNIINLINYLPKRVRSKCINDINNCAIERNNENKTEWILPEQIIIHINEESEF